MTVQINTDKTISGSKENINPFLTQIKEGLSRFSSNITRIEVHLSDENGKNEGLNDIRCMMEARQEGKQPIAVTNQADTSEQAVSGALDKLKTSLETISGKERNY
ncbi:HPF/RaiA family ribosome-associated protein [Lacihabitans sp. LS3-19]|uniref:HPF/RaiA family ribosome-associated protein n=1 Tax=Lacihabitans sp. LS3-19 TaxID=2487335 RepID=UPI0020CF97D4|nr:HPF/RaiA family ribosome-associated protein [Lacihabitans sp. LS3-19]MCP9769893.1 HPF/RaiA family ribosome-associated protein [Lacihabitans sp. LS3-19]